MHPLSWKHFAQRAAGLATGLAATCLAFGQPANDFCTTPTSLSGFAETAFSTAQATTDGPTLTGCGPTVIHEDVWFCWTSPVTGPVTLS
ncbi:MAG: hypothetical protein ACK5ZV_03330, partial [bacterium]